METKVALLAYINILPGFEDEVFAASFSLAAVCCLVFGGGQFVAYTQNDSPQTIIIYEVYKNDEAFQLHKATPHATAFFEFLKGRIVDNNIEVVFLTGLNHSI